MNPTNQRAGHGATPRTDEEAFSIEGPSNSEIWMVRRSFARLLERESATLSADLTAAQARVAELSQENTELKRMLDSRREMRFVDASPDEGLAARILAAYIDYGTTESNPPLLGELMNKWQAERNAIIEKALADLARADALQAEVDYWKSRFETQAKECCNVFDSGREALRAKDEELAAARKECEEQARLNGMGASRAWREAIRYRAATPAATTQEEKESTHPQETLDGLQSENAVANRRGCTISPSTQAQPGSGQGTK